MFELVDPLSDVCRRPCEIRDLCNWRLQQTAATQKSRLAAEASAQEVTGAAPMYLSDLELPLLDNSTFQPEGGDAIEQIRFDMIAEAGAAAMNATLDCPGKRLTLGGWLLLSIERLQVRFFIRAPIGKIAIDKVYENHSVCGNKALRKAVNDMPLL